MKFHAALLCPIWDVNQPLAQHLHTGSLPGYWSLSGISVIRSTTVSVSQRLCASDLYLLMSPKPFTQLLLLYYDYNCSTLFLVIALNRLPCLIYKLKFITRRIEKNIVAIGFGSTHGRGSCNVFPTDKGGLLYT